MSAHSSENGDKSGMLQHASSPLPAGASKKWRAGVLEKRNRFGRPAISKASFHSSLV